MKDIILSTQKDIYTRRKFIRTSTIVLAAVGLAYKPVIPATKTIKAILFDGLVIFNPAPVYALANRFFPEKSSELCALWRSKQFEYTWLRTTAKQYTNFWHITEDALVYATKKTGVVLSPDQQSQLMAKFLELDIWPDVLTGLMQLKEEQFSLSLLSNFTDEMMNASLKRNQLEPFFDHKLSADEVREYKPSPNAYQLSIDTLKLKKNEILFAAFGGWDAAGAKLFGYPTFWINRGHSATEELGTTPDGIGYDLQDLSRFLKL